MLARLPDRRCDELRIYRILQQVERNNSQQIVLPHQLRCRRIEMQRKIYQALKHLPKMVAQSLPPIRLTQIIAFASREIIEVKLHMPVCTSTGGKCAQESSQAHKVEIRHRW